MNGVEPVGEAAQPGRPARYSTRELLETERAALALVERGIASDAPSVSAEATETTVRETPTLTAEQTAMLRAVASSQDRVICVVGHAGSGKTTAARAVADAFRAARVPVIGAAPSGIAAEKLQDETGIPATTLHRLLQQPLPERCLVVVDEAGMAETRILAPLLERVEHAHAKIVLIGDASQLPAVGSGGLFTGIVERHGAIELGENRRQRDRDERHALESICNGLGRDYLAFAEGNGRLISSDAPVRTKIRLLSDWWEAARSDLREHHGRAAPPRRRRAQYARPRTHGQPRPPRPQAPHRRRGRVRSRRPDRLPPQRATLSASRTAPARRSKRSTASTGP